MKPAPSMSFPRPVSLSDEQLSAVMSAAEPLAPADRDQFLRALASALRNEPGELGDGTVAKVIRHVVQPFFRPPVMVEVRHNSKIGEPIP
jgi:hypothetical protein